MWGIVPSMGRKPRDTARYRGVKIRAHGIEMRQRLGTAEFSFLIRHPHYHSVVHAAYSKPAGQAVLQVIWEAAEVMQHRTGMWFEVLDTYDEHPS